MTNQETAQVLGLYKIQLEEFGVVGKSYISFFRKLIITQRGVSSGIDDFLWDDNWKLRLRPLSDITLKEVNQLGLDYEFTSIKTYQHGVELLVKRTDFEEAIYTILEDGALLSYHSYSGHLILELTRMGFHIGLLPDERVELITKI